LHNYNFFKEIHLENQPQNITPVIILAGGFGTRLSAVVKNVPKPMAPVKGKPFLHYIFQKLQQQNIRQVILSVGYLKEVIQDFFQDNYLGISVLYSVENEPLGTGGGIKNACALIADDAFVLNGDTYFDIELSRLDKSADIAVALKPMSHFDRYGTVELNDNQQIISFSEKQFCEYGLINGGVYYLKKKIFNQIDTPQKFSFEKDILEKHIKDLNIKGNVFDNYFMDIGIPEDYELIMNYEF
jgi:D-glycero-alpha-D-manno-heptose 1-phosphate guanylyltransferase